ncbi:MAG: hypothetical protein U0325_29870 [Polyangiales bacterium]
MRFRGVMLGAIFAVGCGTPVSNGGSPLLPVSNDVRERALSAGARVCARLGAMSCTVAGMSLGEAACNDSFARLLNSYPSCAEPFAAFLECTARANVTCESVSSPMSATCPAEARAYASCFASVPRDAGRADAN